MVSQSSSDENSLSSDNEVRNAKKKTKLWKKSDKLSQWLQTDDSSNGDSDDRSINTKLVTLSSRINHPEEHQEDEEVSHSDRNETEGDKTGKRNWSFL